MQDSYPKCRAPVKLFVGMRPDINGTTELFMRNNLTVDCRVDLDKEQLSRWHGSRRSWGNDIAYYGQLGDGQSQFNGDPYS